MQVDTYRDSFMHRKTVRGGVSRSCCSNNAHIRTYGKRRLGGWSMVSEGLNGANVVYSRRVIDGELSFEARNFVQGEEDSSGGHREHGAVRQAGVQNEY